MHHAYACLHYRCVCIYILSYALSLHCIYVSLRMHIYIYIYVQCRWAWYAVRNADYAECMLSVCRAYAVAVGVIARLLQCEVRVPV